MFDTEAQRWTGRYLLASKEQVNFANSLLERLILPDEVLRGHITDLAGASVELAGKVIEKLLEAFMEQEVALNPVSRLKYYQAHT